jgi:hypothetical protein
VVEIFSWPLLLFWRKRSRSIWKLSLVVPGPKLVSSSYCWFKASFHLHRLTAKVRVNGQLFDNAPVTGRVYSKLASGVQSF